MPLVGAKRPPAPYPIRCVRCGGRVRWRWVVNSRYEPAGEWELPSRCSHCSVKAAPGFRSIAVICES